MDSSLGHPSAVYHHFFHSFLGYPEVRVVLEDRGRCYLYLGDPEVPGVRPVDRVVPIREKEETVNGTNCLFIHVLTSYTTLTHYSS